MAQTHYKQQIKAFAQSLRQEERAQGTIENYLRHLFARAFYNVCRDVAKLADVLGHSSLETARLYLISTGKEHERQLERLGFVK